MRLVAVTALAIKVLVACSSGDARPGQSTGESTGTSTPAVVSSDPGAGDVSAPTGGAVTSSPIASSASGVTLVDGIEVFTVERAPDSSGSSVAPTVLFLHGAAFTSADWVELGILDEMAAAGFRAVAVDLPGFGATDAIAGDRGGFLGALIEQVDDGGGIVVVSPSMSGSFSLDLIAIRVPESMVGFVPVAPVGITGFVDGVDTPVESLPTLIVWGENDGTDISQAELLATALPASSIEVIDDAGHAAYRDRPAAFTRLLIEFLGQLPARQR